MTFEIRQCDADYWRVHMCEDAHVIAFGERRSPTLERADFVIIAVDVEDVYSGFISCKEMDAKTLYWQFGGPMPNYRGTVHTIQMLSSALQWSLGKYSRIFCKVDNTNFAMIKMAMKLGFLITGVSNFNGKTLVELSQESFQGGRHELS